jgi:hypothetical protein
MSAFGIPLQTGSGQQCMLASQGAETSAACIFAHINLQILYPYVVIYRAGTVPGLQVAQHLWYSEVRINSLHVHYLTEYVIHFNVNGSLTDCWCLAVISTFSEM